MTRKTVRMRHCAAGSQLLQADSGLEAHQALYHPAVMVVGGVLAGQTVFHHMSQQVAA